jgi:hypothetical protein
LFEWAVLIGFRLLPINSNGDFIFVDMTLIEFGLSHQNKGTFL